MDGSDRAKVIDALGNVAPDKWDAFVTIVQYLITEDMHSYERSDMIAALGNVAPSILFHEKFAEMIKSLKTEDMNGYERAKVIIALGKVAPSILFHEKFLATAQSLMTDKMLGFNRACVIEALGNVAPESWNGFISKANDLTEDMNGVHRAWVISALGKVAPEKWEQFKTNVASLTEGMDGSDRAWVINSLGNMAPEKWDEFVKTAQSLTKDMNGEYRAQVINALGKVAPEKWDNFVIIAESLMIGDMNGDNRAQVIAALGNLAPETLFHPDFAKIAESLSKYMDGSDRAWVIVSLGIVNEEKIDRVYGQIQRLMQETAGKIKLERNDAAIDLIRQLRDCTSEDQAIAFTNDLIRRVNETQGNVDDNALLTHINSAWARVGGATPIELQELARQRQSTHNKEVHASVAESVKRLQARYSDQLAEGDIFELIHAAVMSVFPADMLTKFEAAKVASIKLVGQDAIDNLLKISPHARAGDGDADTALNVAARALWQGQSSEIQSAIQELVYYHSHKNDLTDAEKLLKTLKENHDFKDGISQIGYEPLLRLIYAAITDKSWGEAKDIPGRWRTLMTRMVRAQNEYRENKEACLAGIFNALLEPLSGVHPDVRIIPSFRAMMQEIALEEDDAKYNERVNIALSYLGENARQDKDYMQVIADVTDARMERQLQNAKDIEALEKFKGDFAALNKKLSDEKFEAAAATLLGGLSETAKETAVVFIESARKSRSIARFSAEVKTLKHLTFDELQTQGNELLKNYPEIYRPHLKNFVLSPVLLQKRSQEAEAVKAAGTATRAVARSFAPEHESTSPAALPRPGLVPSTPAGTVAGASSGEETDAHAEGLTQGVKRLKLSPSSSRENSPMEIE